MARSWTIYNRHYIMNTLFMILVMLISTSGIFAYCIGLFVTVPLSLPMMGTMYLRVFRRE